MSTSQTVPSRRTARRGEFPGHGILISDERDVPFAQLPASAATAGAPGAGCGAPDAAGARGPAGTSPANITKTTFRRFIANLPFLTAPDELTWKTYTVAGSAHKL